ncbi:MAG: putative adhesin [Bacteroidota bacterium]
MNKEEHLHHSSAHEETLSPVIGTEAVGYPARKAVPLGGVSAPAAAWPSAKPVLQAKTGRMVGNTNYGRVNSGFGGVIQRQEDKNEDILSRLEQAPKFTLDEADFDVDEKKVVVLSGHGAWNIDDGAFQVPQGITLYYYARHADPTYNIPRLDKLAASGADVSQAAPPVEVVRGGEMTYDYTLYPEDSGIRNVGSKKGNARYLYRVQGATRLSQLLTLRKVKNIGQVHWHACRVIDGPQWFTTPLGSQISCEDISSIRRKHNREEKHKSERIIDEDVVRILRDRHYVDDQMRRTGVDLNERSLGYRFHPKALAKLTVVLEAARGAVTADSTQQQERFAQLNAALLEPPQAQADAEEEADAQVEVADQDQDAEV